MARQDRLVIAGLAVLASAAIFAAGASVVGAHGQDRPRHAAAMAAGQDGQAGIAAFEGRGGRGGRMRPGGPFRHGGPGGPGERGFLGGPMLFGLDLTDAARQQIKTIRDEARTASEPYQELLHRTQAEIGELVHAEAFDESAVRALAVNEGKALTELRVIGARAQAAVFALLTPEQRAALEERRPPRPPR